MSVSQALGQDSEREGEERTMQACAPTCLVQVQQLPDNIAVDEPKYDMRRQSGCLVQYPTWCIIGEHLVVDVQVAEVIG